MYMSCAADSRLPESPVVAADTRVPAESPVATETRIGITRHRQYDNTGRLKSVSETDILNYGC
jgi:hypothetical protein